MMLAIDIIGLLATICLIGLRYPHYVLAAAFIHEVGRVFMTVFLHGQIDYIVAAGAFGSMTVSNHNSGIIGFLFTFSGPIANYIVSSFVGGIAFEPTSQLLNPVASLRFPFSVVNFRLCIASCLIAIWKIIVYEV